MNAPAPVLPDSNGASEAVTVCSGTGVGGFLKFQEWSQEGEVLPLAVVIVNYNAGPLLAQCVRSLSNAAAEIWVVDNHSTDDSLGSLREFTGVRVLGNPVNRGFAAACNQGLAHSSQPYVLFLNPDAMLDPGALNCLFQVLEQHPRAGMAGGCLVGPDGREQGGGRRAFPTPWRALVRLTGLYRLARWDSRWFFDFYLHRSPLPLHPEMVEAISGACMLVRRTASTEVGDWDEGYFLHCEDLDWCYRFHQAGWEIWFVPAALVRHRQGSCSRTRPLFVAWHKHRGMARFYRKFLADQQPLPLRLLVYSGIGARLLGVWALLMVRQSWGRWRRENQ